MNIERRKIYVVLLHCPMVDRHGNEVTTAVTNLDIHDIARTCKTYGITKYFIVNPEVEQERMVRVILEHWKEEVTKVYHPSRVQALSLARFARTFEEAYNEVALETGSRPFVVMPDARDLSKEFSEIWSYEELRERLVMTSQARESGRGESIKKGESLSGLPGDNPGKGTPVPLMIVFGTGWGISPTFFSQVDRPLKPLRRIKFSEGDDSKYNHLSVRAAAAIILDRILGDRG